MRIPRTPTNLRSRASHPPDANPDAVLDVRAIFQHGHHDLRLENMPPVLLPRKGRFALVDYEKIFCSDPDAGDIFTLRSLNREEGCMVLVRPDQYVANILPLEAHAMLHDFLARLLVVKGDHMIGEVR